MAVRGLGLVVLGSLLVVAGCGGGDGAGNASCRGMFKRFEACGVVDGGAGVCFNEAETALQSCLAQCINQATCEEIVDWICEDDSNRCIRACYNGGFRCRSGATVDADEECDGFEDCADGSDEDHCQPTIFRCDDFNREPDIAGTRVCDGIFDCLDGRDEAECGEFTCQ